MAKIIKTKGENKPEKDEHNDDFDGIKELNNPAPNWIILVFIATIGFSLFYGIRYFGYPGRNKLPVRASVNTLSTLTILLI